MVDTLNSCFEYGICLICCHALLCIASLCSKNVHAFCHCVSSVTVILWQKVNLTNNHLIFQNRIGVILCENNWRLILHITQHTAIASSYWTTKNKGYGFYWPALYIAPKRLKTQVLERQRAKPSKIKTRYSRLTCKNCSYLCAPL